MLSDENFDLSPFSRRHTFDGDRLTPGVNLDHIDIPAGLREMRACGYEDARTEMVISYALNRWKRGEELEAERGACDLRFHGIAFICWRRVLAAAMAAGSAKAARDAT